MTDVLVLGAGVIGLSVAFELARRGAAVTILERGLVGHGASWAAGGMLAPLTEDLPPGPLRDLALASLARYPAFAAALFEASGVDVQLTLSGILDVAYTDDQLAGLADRAQRITAAGYRAELLTRAQVYEYEGALGPAVIGGVFCPAEGQVENRRLARALLGAVRRAGVRVRECVTVEALECNQRRALGVRTSEGFCAAGVVVNTLGAWAGTLEGVPLHAQVDVRPVKGQMLALAMSERYVQRVIWAPGMYAIPRRDGRLVIGATVEDLGFDQRITAGGIAHLLQAALRALPGAAAFALSETWVGHRPATADGELRLQATTLEDYFVAGGHSRNGILLAPISGSYMADLIEKQRPETAAESAVTAA